MKLNTNHLVLMLVMLTACPKMVLATGNQEPTDEKKLADARREWLGTRNVKKFIEQHQIQLPDELENFEIQEPFRARYKHLFTAGSAVWNPITLATLMIGFIDYKLSKAKNLKTYVKSHRRLLLNGRTTVSKIAGWFLRGMVAMDLLYACLVVTKCTYCSQCYELDWSASGQFDPATENFTCHDCHKKNSDTWELDRVEAV